MLETFESPFSTAAFVLSCVVLAFIVCWASDRRENKRRLKLLRQRMALEREISDNEFAAEFPEQAAADVIEMRRMLGALLGVDHLKIRPEWRFREDPNLKNMEGGIFHVFAVRYAPERLHGTIFAFPEAPVPTVREFFLETIRFKSDS